MAKGDDSIRKKRNKSMRKRLASSESAVSARIAAIIAAKQRRKTGRRRMCQGMCFTLPTPDDPFNDRDGQKKDPPNTKGKKPIQQKKPNDRKRLPSGAPEDDPSSRADAQPKKNKKHKVDNEDIMSKIIKDICSDKGDIDYKKPSTFFTLCMHTILDSWKEEDESEAFSSGADGSLSLNEWGIELWKCCTAGSNILDTSGMCTSREKVVWLVSTASEIVTRRDKQGQLLPSPFLLYIVPSQERAIQVRSVCKPLKDLGVHTISLHPGASLEHQVNGLKSCEPEFLISTPERLLKLTSLNAIDISGVSLLVLDGLKTFHDLGLIDKVNSIRESISGEAQVIILTDGYSEVLSSLAKNLIRGRVSRLSQFDTIASQAAFISQHVHFCTADKKKLLKVKEILTQTFTTQGHRPLKLLLIARTAVKVQVLSSSLKDEGYVVSDDLRGASTIAVSEQSPMIFVKDEETLDLVDLKHFDCVILLDFPSSLDSYIDILENIARHSISGVLHALFCKEDAPLAPKLIEVLVECNQTVPKKLRTL